MAELLARLPQNYAVRAESMIDGRSWIQVMPVISKAQNGPWFFTVTAEDLKTYAASIEEQSADHWTIPVDRDHGGDASNPDLVDTRAAGWFTGATKVLAAGDVRPDKLGEEAAGPELWAEVKWTPRAIQEIQDGEFRFISPTFTFKERDSKTGLRTKAKQIIAATLTNRPFFNMAPVTAAVVWAPEEGYEHIRELLREALNANVPEGEMARYWVMDVAEGKALVCECGKEEKNWVVPFSRREDGVEVAPESEWTEAEKEWVSKTETALAQLVQVINQGASSAHDQGDDDMDLKVIASALGLAEDADEAAITAALTAQKAEREQLEAKVTELEAAKASGEDASELEQVKADLAETRAELDLERSEALLAEAVEKGRIPAASKEEIGKQFKGNLEGLKAMLAALPEGTVALAARGSDKDAPKAADTADKEAEIKAGDEKHDVIGTDLVVRAEKILTDSGKSEWTEEEFAKALEQAERAEKVAA